MQKSAKKACVFCVILELLLCRSIFPATILETIAPFSQKSRKTCLVTTLPRTLCKLCISLVSLSFCWQNALLIICVADFLVLCCY